MDVVYGQSREGERDATICAQPSTTIRNLSTYVIAYRGSGGRHPKKMRMLLGESSVGSAQLRLVIPDLFELVPRNVISTFAEIGD
jgi:hypothetical protein